MRSSRFPRLQRNYDVLVSTAFALFPAAIVGGVKGMAWPVTLVGMAGALVAGVALWWRRRFPVPAMVVSLAGCLVVQVVAPVTLFPYAALYAVGSLASARPPTISLPALAGVIGVTALAYPSTADGDVTFAITVAVIPWALGEVSRNRRQAVIEGSRRAVSEEQGRIARELHDVLAHSITVIVVQAAAADDVFEANPDQARAALRSIEASARGALGELRTVLTAVRSDDQPWLGRLGELALPLRAAGLTVDLHQEALPEDVPADVDLSAYRIVQEALTNTLRHAKASRADVTVRAAARMLEVEVIDNGAANGAATGGQSNGDGAGRGIAGMRERAALLGGTLEAAALPAGGFRVLARLPVRRGR